MKLLVEHTLGQSTKQCVFRGRIFGALWLTAFVVQFCKHLHEHAGYIRPLNSAYAAFRASIRPDVPITWVGLV